MKNQIKLTILLLLLTFGNGCDKKDGTEPAPSAQSPVGEWINTRVERGLVGITGVSNITEDCDLLSTIKFNSNNTIEFINYNTNSSNDCSDSETITGQWISDGLISGGFEGELIFDSTFQGNIITNGGYSSQGQTNNFFVMYFRTIIDGEEYDYILDFQRN